MSIPRAGPRSNSKPAERKTARNASKQTAPPQPTDNLRKYIRFEPLAPRAGPGRALHIGSARAGRARRRAAAAMEESKPPSINDCLAQLRQCLDPAAAAAIEQLNAAINARVDLMLQAGLLDEVKTLLAAEQPLSRTARQALGYKELIDHLEGVGTTCWMRCPVLLLPQSQSIDRQTA